MSVRRWVVVSLAAAVVGYHVIVAIHSLAVILDQLPYLIAVGVFVVAATVSLLPWGGLRIPTWVALGNLLVSLVIPEVVSTQISAAAQVQIDHAAWYVGGIGILMVITSVRRHYVFAWLGIAALVAHTVLLGGSPSISPIAVGMSAAWVGIAHTVSVTLDRIEKDARGYALAERAAVLWRAEAEARVTERQERVRQTSRVASATLREIVSRRGRLSPELREECLLLEAMIRDEIRGRLLLNDSVRDAVMTARRAGASVLLLDEGGLDEVDASTLDRVHRGLSRAIASAQAQRVIVRTAQDREGVAVTVVGVGSLTDAAATLEGEPDDDVRVWFEVGVDGEVRGLR